MGRETGNATGQEQAMIDMNTQTSMDPLIDNIRASEAERQIARDGMHDAELVADLLCRAGNTLRFAGEILGRLLAQQRPSNTGKM
jgi:hypothetical protein